MHAYARVIMELDLFASDVDVIKYRRGNDEQEKKIKEFFFHNYSDAIVINFQSAPSIFKMFRNEK